jgi:hypothetical protein
MQWGRTSLPAPDDGPTRRIGSARVTSNTGQTRELRMVVVRGDSLVGQTEQGERVALHLQEVQRVEVRQVSVGRTAAAAVAAAALVRALFYLLLLATYARGI